MKKIILFTAILITVCSKMKYQQAAATTGNYKDLHDFELDYSNNLQLDMNDDGVTDFAFAVTIAQNSLDNSVEKVDFYAVAQEGSALLVNKLRPRDTVPDAGAGAGS